MRKAQAANVLLCVLASPIWITAAEQLKPGSEPGRDPGRAQSDG